MPLYDTTAHTPSSIQCGQAIPACPPIQLKLAKLGEKLESLERDVNDLRERLSPIRKQIPMAVLKAMCAKDAVPDSPLAAQIEGLIGLADSVSAVIHDIRATIEV